MHPPIRSFEDMSLHLALLLVPVQSCFYFYFQRYLAGAMITKQKFVGVKPSLCPKGVSHTVPAEQILSVGGMKDLLKVLSPDWDHGTFRLCLRLLFLYTLNKSFTHIAGSFLLLHNPKSMANSGIQWSWASWRALNNFSPTQPWHTAKSSHIMFSQESFLDPLFLFSLLWQSALWTHFRFNFSPVKKSL